ncbi:MAG: DUF418 domain-containing protein [Pseudomonadota bacterium]
MIFVVNVKMMANGYNHYVTRALWEGEVAAWIAFAQGEFVHGQFVTIFTALFGAGLALLLAREKPVPKIIVVRRLFWLGIFGALHLIFLREGDILIWYALAGFVALPFARLGGATQLALGAALQMLAYAYYVAFPIPEPNASAILWSSAGDAHIQVSEIMLGPLSEQISARIGAASYYMIDLFLVGGVWIDTLGVMLIGMGLLKAGFLTGQLPIRIYIATAVVGLGVAALEHILGPILSGGSNWEKHALGVAGYIHRFGGALAWSSIVMAAVGAGWKATAFAAAGRTAFTIYILQSVIGLLLFSSLGFGLFGELSLGQLMLVCGGVWAFFLIAAPLWLARYRFGPLEWIWRSLTYGQAQPLRRSRDG